MYLRIIWRIAAQSVNINFGRSNVEHINYGVLQDSILGPTLYLIYMNDLCFLYHPNCDSIIIADITTPLAYGKNCHEVHKCNNAVNNLLTRNLENTNFIRFVLPNTRSSLETSLLIATTILYYVHMESNSES